MAIDKRRFFYDTEFMEEPGSIELISIGVVGPDGEVFYAVSSEANHSRANPFVVEHVLPKLPPRDDPAWMTRAEIRDGLLRFLRPSKADKVELWGYYSSYDHVLFCWLFGRMIDLPPGMPMYTRDVKHLCDDKGNPRLPEGTGHHNALGDALWTRDAYLFLQRLPTAGAGLIAAERARQISEEGWDAEHDDEHYDGRMVEAAVAYARYGDGVRFMPPITPPACWPWDAGWWKPTGTIDSLVKAGALIAAEIDRLQRQGGS